jgi:hypothetical protein
MPTRRSTLGALGKTRRRCSEQDNEWQDGRRYFRPETMALIDADPVSEEVIPTLLLAS